MKLRIYSETNNIHVIGYNDVHIIALFWEWNIIISNNTKFAYRNILYKNLVKYMNISF